MTAEALQTQVLVVGAGPVGLSLAIELGLRGIAVTVVEQRVRAGARRAPRPRMPARCSICAAGASRTRCARSHRSRYDYPTDIVFATALTGRTLAVIENAFEGAKRRDPRFNEPAQWVPQYTVEKVLNERLAKLPSVRVMSGTELVDFTQSSSGVSATVRDLASNATHTIRAEYLVGADGARSRVAP